MLSNLVFLLPVYYTPVYYTKGVTMWENEMLGGGV